MDVQTTLPPVLVRLRAALRGRTHWIVCQRMRPEEVAAIAPITRLLLARLGTPDCFLAAHAGPRDPDLGGPDLDLVFLVLAKSGWSAADLARGLGLGVQAEELVASGQDVLIATDRDIPCPLPLQEDVFHFFLDWLDRTDIPEETPYAGN